MLPRGYVASLLERTYQAGFYVNAYTRDALNELFTGEDAVWSIQDGAFHLVATGQLAPGNVPVISAQTGMIGSPERTDKGIKVTTKLDAMIRPGGGIQVNSRLMSGLYRVTKVAHEGEKLGPTWQTEAVGVPV